MTTKPLAKHRNGVDVGAILAARNVLTENPEAAQFQWRAQARWVSGTHIESSIDKFFGLGEELSHRTTFNYSTDHPEAFASEDHGPTPTEMVLVALAGCLGAGIATVAANRGLDLHSVTATVTGDLDMRGMLGIDREVRNGFSGIKVNFEIEADATDEEIASIVAQSHRRSAVVDALNNGTPVSVEVTGR